LAGQAENHLRKSFGFNVPSFLPLIRMISADGNSLTVTLKGKLEGETMKGSADFETAGEGDWAAKKAK
jgi:hypothetical protein